jgi:hypothetical protein
MTRLTVLTAMLLAGCTNHPPGPATLAIEPTDPTTADDLLAVVLADAPDEDGDAMVYRFTWFCDGVERSDVGNTTMVPAEITAKGELWRAVVTPNDGQDDGPSTEATVVVINAAPSAEISLSPEQPSSDEDIVATITGSDPDGDETSFTISWLVGGQATSHSGATLPSDATSSGEEWTIEVTPSDGEDEGELVTASVVIDNSPPVVTSVSIGPDAPTEEQLIEATVEAEDSDGQEIGLSYAWYVDGSLVLEGDQPSIDGEHFDKHQQIQVEVTASDGYASSEPMASNTVTAVNTPPSVEAALVDPTEIYETSTVSCLPSGWADPDSGDAEAYGYTWTVNGTDAGLDTATIDGGSFDKGDTLSCMATPDDGEDSGEPAQSDPVTVLNTPPVIASATLSDTTPDASSTLTVIASSSDDDGDSVSFQYAWYVSGSVVATTPSLSSAYFGGGDTIYAELTPWDGSDTGATVTTDTATVLNSPPSITSISLSPSSPGTDDTITAAVGTSDADGDSVSVGYAWYVGGALVGATGSTLSGALYFDRGDSVYAVATPSDGVDTGSPVTSSTLTVVNSTPSVVSATIDPAAIYETSTATCAAAGVDDPDTADTVTISYAWTVNGSDLGLDTASIDGARFDRGDELICSVTPDDGATTGTPTVSDPVTVLNTPPVIASATLSDTTPDASSTLTVIASSSDDDGDSVSFQYAWYVSGSVVATTPSLSSAYFGGGDTIYAELTPWDGSDTGATVTTDTATVLNSPPSITSISLSPSSPGTDDTITAAVGTSDADGDSVSVGYAWYVGGALVGATGSTLSGALYFDRGDSVYAVATPSDGVDTGSPVTSSTLTVVNSAPSTPGISITPSGATESDDLICSIDSASTDADGDSISLLFTWTVDGASTSGATTTTYPGDTIPSSLTASGDSWTCTVTPSDGTDTGGSATATVSISGWSSSSLNLNYIATRLLGENSGDEAGAWVASAGDVDSDGFADLLVGAPENDEGWADAGQAYLLLGSDIATSGSVDLRDAALCILGEDEDDLAGLGMAGGADLDLDGYDDFAIGKPNYDSSNWNGGVYIFMGSPSAYATPSTVTLSDATYRIEESSRERAGASIAMDGHMDLDGQPDLLIGAPYHNAPAASSAGGVYVVRAADLSSPGDVSLTSAYAMLEGESYADYVGWRSTWIGDMDGDGLDDIGIGAESAVDRGLNLGVVYIVLADDLAAGTSSLRDASYAYWGQGDHDYAGEALGKLGDLDGDGLADLSFGAYGADQNGTNSGRAYVLRASELGSAGDHNMSEVGITIDGDTGDYLAKACTGLSDNDGDGRPELAIGVPYQDYGSYANVGGAYLFYSGTLSAGGSFESADADYFLSGTVQWEAAGDSLANLGDVDGNGKDDLLVGAPSSTYAVAYQGGSAFVVWMP